MSEHTPTPWQSHGSHIYSPDKNIICQVHNPGNKERDYPLVENAAFIVRACNAHEALVNALAAAFALVNDNADEFAGHVHPDKINRVVDMATEALALALARGKVVPNAR